MADSHDHSDKNCSIIRQLQQIISATGNDTDELAHLTGHLLDVLCILLALYPEKAVNNILSEEVPQKIAELRVELEEIDKRNAKKESQKLQLKHAAERTMRDLLEKLQPKP